MQDMAGITEKEVEIDFISVGKRIKKKLENLDE